MQAALGNLVGNAAPALQYVNGQSRQEVTIDATALAAAGPPNRPSSLQLVQRLINSGFSVSIKPTTGASRAEPVRYRLWYTLRLGQEAAATTMGRVRRDADAGRPGAGGDVDVLMNLAQLGGASSTWTVNAGVEQQVAAPDAILLGHELGHADRFMRGEGAFEPGGGHSLGQFNHPSGKTYAAPLEEIYNIGLAPGGGTAANPDTDAVSENMLRAEHNLDPRSRYT